MLAIVGASGKIGGATLSSLLSENIIPASDIVCTTSSTPNSSTWKSLAEKGVQVRHATFDDPSSMEEAFKDCDHLFLVSSPRIQMDYHDAPYGTGREKDHFVALNAAEKVGVKRIYYTSLAFANPSKSNVMTAHERTEERLQRMEKDGMEIVVLREGLYNESWPLYFGHFDVTKDERSEILVAGDGKLCWTAIADLGLATAMIIVEKGGKYVGKTAYLSNTKDPQSLEDIARIVSKAKGKKIKLKVVNRKKHEDFYIQERKLDPGHINWWAATYDALESGECEIKDETLERLLKGKGRICIPVEQTITEMLT